MKNPIKTLTLKLANFYGGLPIKPFSGPLRRLYLKHLQGKMKEDKKVISEIDGIKYELNLNQYSELETYYGGGYEPEVVKIIKQYVRPGMSVMDIGARVGLHTMRLKKLAGREGKVFAIEPDEKTFSILLKNAGLNNFSIIAENKAFADKDKDHEITLDSYVREKRIGRLDFIKLDTDGFEYQIVKGGIDTLKRFKPVMVVEFNKKSLENGSLEQMLGLLKSLGYSFFDSKSLKEYPDNESIFKKIAIGGGINVLCK